MIIEYSTNENTPRSPLSLSDPMWVDTVQHQRVGPVPAIKAVCRDRKLFVSLPKRKAFHFDIHFRIDNLKVSAAKKQQTELKTREPGYRAYLSRIFYFFFFGVSLIMVCIEILVIFWACKFCSVWTKLGKSKEWWRFWSWMVTCFSSRVDCFHVQFSIWVSHRVSLPFSLRWFFFLLLFS